jgi:mRNA-degrading endonuclease RelE of RelBE toxin-antitoxin system
MAMNYESTPEFNKDLKKLLKKFRTLEDDIEIAKINAIELYHEREINNLSVFQVSGYGTYVVKIFKLKKFSCKALKGRGVQSGIRIIYAFHPQKQLVEFIEIYYKADQTNEDEQRIKDYLKSLQISPKLIDKP